MMGQEHFKVDLDRVATKSQPVVTTSSGIGPAASSAPDESKRPWKLELVPFATPNGVVLYEIHFVNVSNLVIVLPISQDGSKLAEVCPNHTLTTAVVSLSQKDERFSRIRLEVFYGCETLPDTITRIKPGEWVAYVGKGAKTSTDARAEVILSKVTYLRKDGVQTSNQLATEYYYSAWQTHQ